MVAHTITLHGPHNLPYYLHTVYTIYATLYETVVPQ
jgi:hypothetical protein